MMFIGNRRYLPIDHPLRLDATFLTAKSQSEPYRLTNTDVRKFHLACSRCSTNKPKEAVFQASGCKKEYVLMLDLNHDRTQHVVPDFMYADANGVSKILQLLDGTIDLQLSVVLKKESIYKSEKFTKQLKDTIHKLDSADNPDQKNTGNTGKTNKKKTEKNKSRSKGLFSTAFMLSKENLKLAKDRAKRINIPQGSSYHLNSLFSQAWKAKMNSHDLTEVCITFSVYHESLKTFVK